MYKKIISLYLLATTLVYAEQDSLEIYYAYTPFELSGWSDALFNDAHNYPTSWHATYLYFSKAATKEPFQGIGMQYSIDSPSANLLLTFSANYGRSDTTSTSASAPNLHNVQASMGVTPYLDLGPLRLSFPINVGYSWIFADFGKISTLFDRYGNIAASYNSIKYEDDSSNNYGYASKDDTNYVLIQGLHYQALAKLELIINPQNEGSIFVSAGYMGSSMGLPDYYLNDTKVDSSSKGYDTAVSNVSATDVNSNIKPFANTNLVYGGVVFNAGVSFKFGISKRKQEEQARQAAQYRQQRYKQEQEKLAVEQEYRRRQQLIEEERLAQLELDREAKRIEEEKQIQALLDKQACPMSIPGWIFLSKACQDDLAHGKGKARTYDGKDTFKGTFQEGNFKQGRWLKDGALYFDGPYEENKPHGEGICMYDESPEKCEFYYGKRIDTLHKMRKENNKRDKIEEQRRIDQESRNEQYRQEQEQRDAQQRMSIQHSASGSNALEEMGNAALNCAAGLAAKELCNNIPWPGNDICVAAAKSQFSCLK